MCNVIDLALIIDNSGSIEDAGKGNYKLLKDFIKSLLDSLDISEHGTHVGALRFSSDVHTEFRLNTYNTTEDMKDHITHMDYAQQFTNISGALWKARQDIFKPEYGDRSDVQNVALVIADGESNVDANLTHTQAEQIKREGVKVFVVAVLTKKFDENQLKYIASDPDSDHYFVSPSIKNLPKIKSSLTNHICNSQNMKGPTENSFCI